jgi:hypothetical protein
MDHFILVAVIVLAIWLVSSILTLGLVRTYINYWKKLGYYANYPFSKSFSVFMQIYLPIIGVFGLMIIWHLLLLEGYPLKLSFRRRLSIMEEVNLILNGDRILK